MPFPFINHITTAILQVLATQVTSRSPNNSTTLQHPSGKLSSACNDTPMQDEFDSWLPDNYYYAG